MKSFTIALFTLMIVSGFTMFGVANAQISSSVTISNSTNQPTQEELLKLIEELLLVIDKLKAQIITTQAVTNNNPFTYPVIYGETNKSIELLQKILATDSSIYPKALVTGYFGDLTKEALVNFQIKYKLPVTGTFSVDTETVLVATLQAIPYSTYPNDYLSQPSVTSRLKSVVAGEAPADVVVGGKVVLGTQPVFSEDVMTSDTATVQRILKTDSSISLNLTVNGKMDAMTTRVIMTLRMRYGIPYSFPPNGKVVISDLMNAQTTDLFRKILEVNNASTIKPGLLLMSEVAPSKLISNSSRTLSKIRATRDYRKNNTSVFVTYEGGATEGFTITAVSPNSAVVTEIATKLGRPVENVKAVISYDSINGNDFESILLKIDLATQMDINVVYKDGTTEYLPITSNEVDIFVDRVYGGDYVWYKRDFDMYVEKARRGENVEIVYDMVAGVVGATSSEVKAVLKIDVEEYDKSDPCWNGDVWVCHGA